MNFCIGNNRKPGKWLTGKRNAQQREGDRSGCMGRKKQKSSPQAYACGELARREGFEPPAFWSVATESFS